MDDQTLKQYLESRERELSEIDFFALAFDALEAPPSQETPEVLESYLLKYSHVDEDRVARYLGQFLSDSRDDRLEFALLELSTLARTTDTLAHKILAKFRSQWEQHKIPPAGAREALEIYLMTLANLDPDRVVRYLEPFLSDPNPVRSNFTAMKIDELV